MSEHQYRVRDDDMERRARFVNCPRDEHDRITAQMAFAQGYYPHPRHILVWATTPITHGSYLKFSAKQGAIYTGILLLVQMLNPAASFAESLVTALSYWLIFTLLLAMVYGWLIEIEAVHCCHCEDCE